MLVGANKVADAAKVTLGPKGRYVAMNQKANVRGAAYRDRAEASAPTLVTNDGATVAESIALEDPAEEMGARLMREVAQTAGSAVGDGTTTAMVLAQQLLVRGTRLVEAGADPLALRRGLQAAGTGALEALADMAEPARDIETLTQIATISCDDEDMARIVGEAVHAVGVEGVVNVEESQRTETKLEIDEGIVFEQGHITPNMALNEREGTSELFDPYILLTDASFSDPQDLLPFLIISAEDGHPALVICDDITGDALGMVLQNKAEGDMDVVCIKAPLYGEGRRWRLDDMAVQTGGVFVTSELGMNVRGVTREMVGRAERAFVNHKRTVITGAAGNPELVRLRENELRNLIEHTDYEFNRKRYQERLATFVSGVARIAVGGQTKPEMWERKMRIEDAVGAAKAAREEGIVPGGGSALISLVPVVRACAETLPGEEQTGALLLADALTTPTAQIAENAGHAGAAIVARLLEQPAGMGFDAKRGRFANMIEAGIIDPVSVTKHALTGALSLAGTFLGVKGAVFGKAVEERREERA